MRYSFCEIGEGKSKIILEINDKATRSASPLIMGRGNHHSPNKRLSSALLTNTQQLQRKERVSWKYSCNNVLLLQHKTFDDIRRGRSHFTIKTIGRVSIIFCFSKRISLFQNTQFVPEFFQFLSDRIRVKYRTIRASIAFASFVDSS